MSLAATPFPPSLDIPARTGAKGIDRVRAIRWLLIVLAGLAAAGMFAHLALALWAQNEFSQPESVIANQSRLLVRDGTLYYGLTEYPYTVCAYMPLFYHLEALANRVGVPLYQAGRLISFLALCGVTWLVWQLVLLYTNDRRYAWTSAILCGCTSGLTFWGTTGQTDMLAVLGSVACFYFGTRYWVAGDQNALTWASLCGLAGLMSKQTALAGPASVFLFLCLKRHWRAAVRFGGALALGGAVLVALINTATHGHFLLNTVFANMNPLAWEKIEQHYQYWLLASLPLGFVVAVGIRTAWRTISPAPFLYWGIAMVVLALTAGKLGSDSNYQVESSIVLNIASVIALASLDFYGLLFTSTKSWAPLLVMPLLLQVVTNVRLEIANLLVRYANEQAFTQQVAEIKPHIKPEGRLLMADMNALLRLDRRPEVEYLIYRFLVNAGRIDPTRVTRDLQAHAFRQVVLYHDVASREPLHGEVPTLEPEQLEVIRRQYHLVAHAPGPYLGGLYLYEPN